MAALAARENRVVATVDIVGGGVSQRKHGGVRGDRTHATGQSDDRDTGENRPEVQGIRGRGWIVRDLVGQSTA